MRRIKIFSESRAVIFAVLIIAAIAITGIILYINLSGISLKLTDSVKPNSPASVITRQILIELRSGENDVNSFHLMHDSSYIESFYKTIPNLDKQIGILKKLAVENSKESGIIDSIIILTRERFALIKVQLAVEDPVNVANELNVISQKIDETFRQQQATKVSAANTDTLSKINAFFKRLFRKKESLSDTELNKYKDESKNKGSLSYKEQLKNAVLNVKSSQMQQLAEYKQSDYQLSKDALHLMEKINFLADELKHNEDLRSLQEANDINKEVNRLKYYSILFSIVISSLLFMLVFLFRNYIKKKNQYELALVESRQRAEDLAKTKETFLANMSHEIKTPLNAIYGFTEQILSGGLKPEQEQQFNVLKSSAAYLTKLVNNILTYAKLQSGKSQSEIADFDLKKELSYIEELFKNQAITKGITLIFETDKLMPEIIRSDVNKIKQIIFNIVGNAIKFTNKGVVKFALKITGNNENRYIKIVVADTGIGIKEENIPKLFNEFEQGDDKIYEKYGGTGLGLMITKQIVEQLSGRISISSRAKVGTTVTITIPIEVPIDQQIKSVTGIEDKTETDMLKGKSILIVDDEEYNRLLLRSILKKYGVNIIEAVNGNEAIVLVKNQTPDLVIMDIRMPEKSGIEATEDIRKFETNLPILASTAVISEEKVARCIHAGINGFVFKPFIEKELLERLSNTLKGTQQPGTSGMNLSPHVMEPKKIRTDQKIINLENIKEQAGSDESFRKEMIQIFHKSINNGLSKIEEFAAEKKYPEISEVAHKIIPSCRHFEADELYDVLKYFESLREKPEIESTEFEKNLAEMRIQVNAINKELELHL